MPNAFENLPRAAFVGLEFPVESVRVRGGLRYHVHEYPHVPGGDLEKLGRKLYEVEMHANFQATFAKYPGLWPQRLEFLRTLFDAGTTGELVIPTIGPMQACATEWDQEMTARILSGEKATFKFIEDQESAFAFKELVSVDVAGLAALAADFEFQADKYQLDRSITDQLVDAVNAVLAVSDQIDAYGLLLAAKIGMVAALCNEFDQRVDAFGDPTRHPVLDAMKELWAASQSLAKNVQGTASSFALYEVKTPMTIGDVSTAIYGDTTHAIELLQLNPIENAFDIRPGTTVRYIRSAESRLIAA